MPCDWPCEASTCDAADNLFEIIDRAIAALRVDVAAIAVACARHDNTFGGTLTLQEHLKHTQDALAYANNNQWMSCIEELEHIGTGGGNYTQKQEETPPASLVAQVEQQLAEWKVESESKEYILLGRRVKLDFTVRKLRPRKPSKKKRKKRGAKKAKKKAAKKTGK